KNNLSVRFALAARGYVTVSPTYRFAPKSPFPAQLHDAKGAVRWLRANAARYRVDRDRIAALGYSAGGQLACLLGTTAGVAELEGTVGHPEQPSSVQAVVSHYPVVDLAALHAWARQPDTGWQRQFGRTAVEALLGGPPERVPSQRYAQASPLSYIRKDIP